MERASLFLREKCDYCGECFTRCPYIDLSREEAILEIKRLVEGAPTRSVMQKCVSCQSCDVFCTRGAQPYRLILERWAKRYEQSGIPLRASYMLPYQSPNYREDVIGSMLPAERDLLSKWKDVPVEGEFLYPGCNLLTMPLLFGLPALGSLPVSGDWSLCCGEPYYRLGAFEAVSAIAAILTSYYSDKKISRMVFLCPACLNMFRSVLPNQFGAKLDFECEYFAGWLLRKIRDGKIEITKPSGRSVVVHDSCHGRVMGDEIMEQTRELYRALGLRVVEMKSHHENGICCGIAAGCNRQMPQDIVRVGSRALREAKATGIAETAVYCTGCYLHLGIIEHLSRSGQKLVHTLELLAEATGNVLPRVLEERTKEMLFNIVRKPLPKMLSFRRFKPEIKPK